MAGADAGAASSDGLDAAIDGVMGDGEGTAGGADEARARKLGWRPKDELPRGFRGEFLEPADFIQKIEAETPVLRERLRYQGDVISKLEGKITATEALLKEQGEMLREMRDRSVQAEHRGFNRVREEIEARMDRAVKEADEATYLQAKKELADLDKQRPATPQARTDDPAAKPNGQATNGRANLDPQTQAWIDANPWFLNSEEMRGFAMARDRMLVQNRPNMTLADRLKDVKDEVEKRFPEMFENENRKQAPTVAAPSAPQNQRRPKGKTVADLPDDARAELERFKRLIPKFSDKEYLDNYEWDR